jgi:hypothetical protein
MKFFKRTCKLQLLCILSLVHHISISQTPAFIHYTDDDGLPGMSLYSIRQDRNGFLWMTSTKGICRFDGKEFKKFAVPDIKVQDFPYLFMDSKGIPWFYNLAGEIICIQEDSIINTRIKNPDTRKKINAFFADTSLLYITWRFSNTIETICYDRTDFKVRSVLKKPYSVIGKYNGELLATDLKIREDKFQLYSIHNNKLLFEYPHKSNESFNYHSEINILSELSKDSFAIITPYFSGLFDADFKLLQLYKFRQILNDTVLFVTLVNHKDLFIKTNLNSYIFHLNTNQFKKLSFFGNSVNTVYEDDISRKWITTSNKGLILLLNEDLQIYTINNSDIRSNEIIRITEDYPNLWFHHHNGEISLFNTKINKWSHIIIPGARGVRAVKIKHPGEYFVGTDNGLFTLTYLTDSDYSILPVKQSSIKDLYYTKENLLFILTVNGTYLCNNQCLSNPSYLLALDNALIKSRSTSIVKFQDTILAATLDGIFYFENGRFSKWNSVQTNRFYINKLYNQNNKQLWICTDGNGLYLYKNGILQDSINDSVLPSNSISCLASLDDITIIIGTDNGAYVYNTELRTGFGFNKLDGLPSNEILDIINSGNTIWIGTSKGLVSIPANQLKPNGEIPLLKIKTIQVFDNGKKIQFRSSLPYHANHLRFNLETRSLISKDQLSIYYKLHQSDSNWIESKGNIIELIGLAPGDYNVSLKAINEDGIHSIYSNVLSFHINQIWWKTGWFISLMVLLVTSLSIGMTQWRQNKIKKEEDKKRKIHDQMNQLRQQALQNQMNPHFIFNSLNAIQSFLLVNDEKKAVNYLSKFGKLIRMIFDQSKLKIISLQDELDLLHHYIHLEELRFGNKVKVIFTVDDNVQESSAEIFIPPLLIQPIIENSFRHGLFHLEKNGLLQIRLMLENGQLLCIIEDNGVGRIRSKQINEWKNKYHKSSGIKSTQERLEILDRGRNKLGLEIIDLYDKNGIPTGTKAILKL